MESSWQWMWEFEQRAREEGNSQGLRLVTIYDHSLQFNHDFADERFAIFQQGRDFAQQLGEPWWEMFYRYWMVNALVFDKRQPHLALDYAVRAVFDCSKPALRDFPFRVGLQMSLAAAYRDIDPIGYESELRALFEFIEADCDQYEEDRPYYAQLWSHFLLLIEAPGAVEAAFDYLRYAENFRDEHYIWEALLILCQGLYRFDRVAARTSVGELAAIGEEIARRENRNPATAEFLMWRALAARWDNQEAEAKRFYHQALRVQSKLPPPQNAALYAAMAFHEAGGELERALQICQSDIRILHAHKLTFLEAQRRLDKCRLRREMGRDFSKDAKRLRRVGAKMRSKAHWEARLGELEASPLEK